MEISILNKAEEIKYYDGILKMLKDADDEFFPPLSARNSSTQSDLSSMEKSSDGVIKYFEELKKQSFLVACEDGELLAFVSYRENYSNGEIGEEFIPDIYISTLVVSPIARGKGLTYKMYEELFAQYENVNIFTRTWSENFAHIKILEKFGFETFKVLENDRGEGIDTIYFIKRAKEQDI